MAFDTGPGMAIIDAVAHRVDDALSCDLDGRLAAAGKVNEKVLAELLADPYFAAAPPKSTGRERFGDAYAGCAAPSRCRAPTAWRPRWNSPRARSRTRCGAGPAARARWWPPAAACITPASWRRWPSTWPRCRCVDFDTLFFDGDAKEAVAFALLGYLTLHGQPGNLPAATGARGPRVLGSITPP